MGTGKFYYVIIITSSKFYGKNNKMFYWIRDDEIPSNNINSAMQFVRNNFPEFKKYNNRVPDFLLNEVTEEYFIEFEKWYDEHNIPKDYAVVRD